MQFGLHLQWEREHFRKFGFDLSAYFPVLSGADRWGNTARRLLAQVFRCVNETSAGRCRTRRYAVGAVDVLR